MVYIFALGLRVIIYQEEDIMFSDIEIAQQAKLRPIQEIAEKAGIPDEYVIPYGRDKAKISLDFNTLKDKKTGSSSL